MSVRLWWCPRCAMVRSADVAPICRHYALDLPASWMVALPSWHPIAKDES